jgi:hypothetical protein
MAKVLRSKIGSRDDQVKNGVHSLEMLGWPHSSHILPSLFFPDFQSPGIGKTLFPLWQVDVGNNCLGIFPRMGSDELETFLVSQS